MEPIGQRSVVRGSVRDSDGRPVPNTLVEAGRPTPAVATGTPSTPGRHRSTPRGFGRSETVLGEYAVPTLKPGRVLDGEGGLQAPHVDVSVFARGLLDRVVTGCYSGDEAAANEEDPVLQSLPEAARRTLVAEPTDDGYRLDVVLQASGTQGRDETVFFTV